MEMNSKNKEAHLNNKAGLVLGKKNKLCILKRNKDFIYET